MTLLGRWWRFSAVGIAGFAVQMGTLALLRHVCRTHYLMATAAALELTLLHNFFWHRRSTWRDRRGGSAMAQLVRFHVSNGLVSFAGNLLVVRVLVGGAHVGLLIANAAAVVCCALANFALGNLWAFADDPHRATAALPVQ